MNILFNSIGERSIRRLKEKKLIEDLLFASSPWSERWICSVAKTKNLLKSIRSLDGNERCNNPSVYKSTGISYDSVLRKSGDFASRRSNNSGWLQTCNNYYHYYHCYYSLTYVIRHNKLALRNCMTRFIKFEVKFLSFEPVSPPTV